MDTRYNKQETRFERVKMNFAIIYVVDFMMMEYMEFKQEK